MKKLYTGLQWRNRHTHIASWGIKQDNQSGYQLGDMHQHFKCTSLSPRISTIEKLSCEQICTNLQIYKDIHCSRMVEIALIFKIKSISWIHTHAIITKDATDLNALRRDVQYIISLKYKALESKVWCYPTCVNKELIHLFLYV